MCFLSPAQRALFGKGLPIFVLHKVAAVPGKTLDPFDYIRPDRLEEKLAALHSAGLTATTLDCARQSKPDSFILTFDDGYANVFANALEVLARRKVAAIQFLVAGRLGACNDWDVAKGEVREPLMDDVQVREWLAAGQQIGSHSLTHPNLKRLSLKAAREEIAASKKLLEDRFGSQIRHFSYPSGKFTPEVQELVQEAGYETACGIEFGINGTAHPPFALHRIAPLYSRELFAKALHRLKRKFVNLGQG
jgi:peptidoglycan/xylan/chitin deacetylase (PgdA/CDA1 family)